MGRSLPPIFVAGWFTSTVTSQAHLSAGKSEASFFTKQGTANSSSADKKLPVDFSPVNAILEAWNHQDVDLAAAAALPCCSSSRWAYALAAGRPYPDEAALFANSDAIWTGLTLTDWDEALASHPRIGMKKVPPSATIQSASWSDQEQQSIAAASAGAQEQLRHANDAYESRFGRTYIVCATGKSAEEMLAILLRRLNNDGAQELDEAVEQQRQITQLRLRKWLQS